MTGKLIGVITVLMLLVCIQRTFAMSEGILVTKETQAKQGLDFTLSAVRVSASAVIVRIEIPKKGKLKDLKRVRMTIGTGSPLVSSTLEAKPGKNGNLVISFQLSPELADKCSIDLVVPWFP